MYKYLLPPPPPPPPPLMKRWIGIPWNPRQQLLEYQLKPVVQVSLSGTDIDPLLGASPNRLCWYCQPQDTSGSQTPVLLFSPLKNFAYGGLITNDTTFPYRCHAAEFPGLCQAEWFVFSPTGAITVNVWEVVML